MGAKLTDRQELFCQGVVAGKTHTQACLDAGYSPKSAMHTGDKLLKNAKIQARLAELRGLTEEKHEITRDWIVERLKDIAENADRDGDKVSALDKLIKMFGYDKDQSQQKETEFVVRFEDYKK